MGSVTDYFSNIGHAECNVRWTWVVDVDHGSSRRIFTITRSFVQVSGDTCQRFWWQAGDHSFLFKCIDRGGRSLVPRAANQALPGLLGDRTLSTLARVLVLQLPLPHGVLVVAAQRGLPHRHVRPRRVSVPEDRAADYTARHGTQDGPIVSEHAMRCTLPFCRPRTRNINNRFYSPGCPLREESKPTTERSNVYEGSECSDWRVQSEFAC